MKQKARKILNGLAYHGCYMLAVKVSQPLRRFRFVVKGSRLQEKIGFDVIIPVYKVSRFMLQRTLASVRAQSYHNWRIILVYSDSERPDVKRLLERCRLNRRMTVVQLPENRGISGNTNAALPHISQDYVTFLDQDDRLDRRALETAAYMAAANRYPDILYSDEDKIVGYTGIHITPHYKPDWNPTLLMTNNYITHMTLYSRDLIRRTGILRRAFDGSQDYDYVLRASELAANIIHIRKVLYHWRIHRRSTAKNYQVKSYAVQAGGKLLEDALERRHSPGAVAADPDFPGVYHINYPPAGKPLVSLIVLGGAANRTEQVSQLLKKTSYEHLDIILAADSVAGQPLFRTGFNLAEQAKGDYLVFLTPDLEPLTPAWLDSLVGFAGQHECGFLSPLLTDHNRIVGPAMAIDSRGLITLFHNLSITSSTEFARMKTTQAVTAFDEGCLLISRRSFSRINRLVDAPDSIAAIVASLLLGQQALPNIWLPQIMMRINPVGSQYKNYHQDAMADRFKLLQRNHSRFIPENDPYYPQVFKPDGSYRLRWLDVYRSLL